MAIDTLLTLEGNSSAEIVTTQTHKIRKDTEDNTETVHCALVYYKNEYSLVSY